MKRILTLLILLAAGLHSFGISDKVRLGLAVSPGVSWSSAPGKDMERGKARFGIHYGFVLEYWFAKNYGITTGLGGVFDGCNIRGRDAFQYNPATGQVRSVVEKYNFNYMELPLYLKLKTNDIKSSGICAWGQVGAALDITVAARANFSDSIPTMAGGMILIEKENVLRPKNDITQSVSKFRANFIDIRLAAGAGIEYRLDDRASLVLGIFYHNGFINNILDKNADPKKEPNLMRAFTFRVGVLF